MHTSLYYVPTPFHLSLQLVEPDEEYKAEEQESIVDLVSTYFFENEDFASSFEKWVDEHSDIVDLESEEYKLEYTELHQKFNAMFEER